MATSWIRHERLNEWNADELIYIDIGREETYDLGRDDLRVNSMDNIETIISEIGKICFMPLTFGGGIRNQNDAIMMVRSGADKVTLNTLLHENKKFSKKHYFDFRKSSSSRVYRLFN